MFVGISYGIHRMFLGGIPKGFDIGGTVGVLALNLLVGGVIGGIILTVRLALAVLYMGKILVSGVLRLTGCRIIGR